MNNDDDDDIPSFTTTEEQGRPASAGSPPQPSNPPDLMSEVLESVGDGATALAKIAARYGLKEDDPAWLVAVAVRDACAAGDNAALAAGRIESATRDVADKIYTQTVRAGDDLKDLVSRGIRETTLEVGKKIGGAIQIVVQRGAEQIKEAAGEVDQTARDQLAKMVQEYRGYLTQAAASEASRRNSLAAATSWISVLVTCIVFLAGGAILTHEYEAYTRHLLPSGYSLNVLQNGKPNCGYVDAVRGFVCVVNK